MMNEKEIEKTMEWQSGFDFAMKQIKNTIDCEIEKHTEIGNRLKRVIEIDGFVLYVTDVFDFFKFMKRSYPFSLSQQIQKFKNGKPLE